MPEPSLFSLPDRPLAAGKYFRRGGRRWDFHGLTYGPFKGPDGLPAPDRVERDLALIAAWGANTLRLFIPPPDWFLDACARRGLGVAAGVAWTDHVDFLHAAASRREVVRAVRETARRLAGRREVTALFVGNEIQAPLVRWLGPDRVRTFLETLIDAARQEAPDLLLAYANYPTTEFLQPGNADFTAFNVYLEAEDAFNRYTARLQNLAGDQPLVISEFGVDVKSRGADRQAAILAWQRRVCRERGVAGNFLFSFTDEWHRGGEDVTGWEFGLTDRDRTPRRAWRELAGGPPPVSSLLPPDPPRVSVIVCTRDGARTLPECLDSLAALDYPDYETLVVDDGSTQDIEGIVAGYPGVRYLRQPPSGLGVARNAGAAATTGEVLAYTDDDCVVDPAWLVHLARAFDRPETAMAGGPNIPPPAQNLSQACVIAAPGGPAHVLLTDTLAEHIPGCNMAIRRSVFRDLNGFGQEYHAAGDDVDFCWRVLEGGYGISFEAGAMVWHYRRFTVRAYLRQQAGYGKAEALLTVRHGEKFGFPGGARWQGVVYQPALRRLARHAGRIYSGVFGSASYQTLYGAPARGPAWLFTGFPWWLLTLGVALTAFWLPPVLWAAALMAAVPLLHALRRACLLPPPRPWRGARARLLLWFLVLAQPGVRGGTRFLWNLRLGSFPDGPWRSRTGGGFPFRRLYKRVAALELWSDTGGDRGHLLAVLMASFGVAGLPVSAGDGWQDWDLETTSGRWWSVRLGSVTEYHGGPRCLTRVRIASRATGGMLLLFALLPAFAAGLVLLTGWHPVWALGVVFTGTVLFETLHRTAVNRAATRIVNAAEGAGFTLAGSPRPAE